MSFRIRLFIEICVIAIVFMAVLFLQWSSFPSVVDDMNFDERFANMKIYPAFMKNFWIMGFNHSILLTVVFRAVFQLFLQRPSDIGFGVGLAILLSFSSILFLLFLFVLSILSNELGLLFIWIGPLILAVVCIINIIYIFYSVFSLETLARFFAYPNWLCSIGLLTLINETWYHYLRESYIPI